MADKNDVIDVEIFGQSYKIRGDADSKHIQKLADFVDEKMREIVDATSTVDTMKVAILASLNIADEYFQLKKELDLTERETRKRVEKYQNSLDEIIKTKT
jgi:cell division protein ZapA